MSVGKLRDGRWYVQYLRDGRTKREYFGRGDDAAARAQARQDELGLRTWTPSRRRDGITFGQLAEKYMDASIGRVRQTTYDRALSVLNSNILPAIGHHPAAALTPDIMDEYARRRLKAVSGTTAHNESALIRTILRWGVKRHHLEWYPLEGWELPRVTTSNPPPPTMEEISRLWAAAAPHVRRGVALLWFLGVRGAGQELLSLRWDMVDWTSQTIQVTSARKGGPATRRIRLHPVLLALLRQWAGEDDCAYIVHHAGKKIGRSIGHAWRRACQRAGLRLIRPYDCRHAFATAIAQGGDLKTLQILLGHASPQITLRTYVHAVASAADAAVSMIPVPSNAFEVVPPQKEESPTK